MAGWLGWRWWAVQARARWTASELGLSADLAHRLVGEIEDCRLVLESVDTADGRRSLCTVELPFDLSPGMRLRTRHGRVPVGGAILGPAVRLGTDLDEFLDARGTAADVRRLLAEPVVDASLRAILDAGGQLLLGDGTLRVWEPGLHLDEAASRVERAVALAHSLGAHWARPWRHVAERLGLRFEGEESDRRLVGNVDGVSIVIQEHRQGHPILRVTAQLKRPLPEGTLLVHPDRGEGRSEAIPDPILGGRLHLRSSAAATVLDRICRDEVRGPLLEVVHGHPGSRLGADRIGLMIKDAPLDPGPAVDLVLELERVLEAC